MNNAQITHPCRSQYQVRQPSDVTILSPLVLLGVVEQLLQVGVAEGSEEAVAVGPSSPHTAVASHQVLHLELVHLITRVLTLKG